MKLKIKVERICKIGQSTKNEHLIIRSIPCLFNIQLVFLRSLYFYIIQFKLIKLTFHFH